MTTVTAKQLRENLSLYLDRMEAGEEIAVIRHSAIIGRLKPAQKARKGNGMAVVAAIGEYHKYLDDNGIKFDVDLNKSVKELYHEALNNDPKYAQYVTKRR
jgi:antitoxin (DNA-binding transcriptional repressor) of toxin-antitoxin stability system